MTGPCIFCGGSIQQSTRIQKVGEDEDAVEYPRYAMKCLHCGREGRDDELRNANNAAAVIARSLFLGIPDSGL